MSSISTPVALNQTRFCSGDIWQYWRRCLLSPWGKVTTGFFGIEAKDVVEYPTMHRAVPNPLQQKRMTPSKMSIVRRLKNPTLFPKVSFFAGIRNQRIISASEANGQDLWDSNRSCNSCQKSSFLPTQEQTLQGS